MRSQASRAMAAIAMWLVANHSAYASSTPVWSQEFSSVGHVLLSTGLRPQLVHYPAVDAAYLEGLSPLYAEQPIITKVDGGGSPLWSAQDTERDNPHRVIPLHDGSVIMISSKITRYSAGGELLWTIPGSLAGGSAITIFESGNDLYLVSSRRTMSRIDRDSGLILESIDTKGSYLCITDNVVLISLDTVYAACNYIVSKIRLHPMRVEWQVELEPTYAHTDVVAADASGAYLVRDTYPEQTIEKLSASGGTLLWSAPSPVGRLPTISLDTDGDLIAHAGSTIAKLNRMDGTSRWLHTTPGKLQSVAATADAIVAVGNVSETLPSASGGFLEHIDKNDGKSISLTALTPPAGYSAIATSVAVMPQSLLVAGMVCAADAAPELCELALWRTTLEGGSVVLSRPLFDLPTFGTAVPALGDTTVAAAIETTAAGQRLHVRRVRNADGAALWDVNLAAELSDAVGRAVTTVNLVAGLGSGDDIGVLYRNSANRVGAGAVGGAELLVLAGDSGQLKWRRSLLDPTGGFNTVRARQLAVGSNGDVFVSIHDAADLNMPGVYAPNRRRIVRYAGDTGTPLSQIEFPPTSNASTFDFNPVVFKMAGTDVLANKVQPMNASLGLTRYDGADGTERWTNPNLAIGDISTVRSVPGFAVRKTPDPDYGVRVLRFDPVNGSIVWESSYANPADSLFNRFNAIRGSDDALYVSAGRGVPNMTFRYRAFLMKVDQASGGISWVNRFDGDRFDSRPSVAFGRNGILHVTHSLSAESYRFAQSVGRYSEASGEALGNEVIGISDLQHPDISYEGFNLLGADQDGGLIYDRAADEPGRPTRFGLQKRLLSPLTQARSLKVDLTLAVSRSEQGATVLFQFDTVNDGALAVQGIDALLEIPELSVISNLACTADGSPCTAKATPMHIGHKTDIAAGGRLRISGTLEIPYIYSSVLIASAFGPGAVELDLQNNIQMRLLTEAIFSTGFD